MSPKSFYAAVKRLRPTITEAQRRIHGEVRDVFLGIEMKSQNASKVSAHSAISSQISLECTEIEEKREKSLNRGNALNALTPLTQVAVNEDLLAEEVLSDDH